MSDNVDVVGAVLKKNVADFERKDAATMATVGYVIAALNIAWAGLMWWRLGGLNFDVAIQLFASVALFGFSFQVGQHSLLAGRALFGYVATILLLRFLAALFTEGGGVIAAIFPLIIAVFVLGKMHPGLGALKFLAEEGAQPNDMPTYVFIACGAVPLAIMALGIVMLATGIV